MPRVNETDFFGGPRFDAVRESALIHSGERLIDLTRQEQAEPSFLESLSAQFEQNNSVISLVMDQAARMGRAEFEPVAGYSPFKDPINDLSPYQGYEGRFASSRSPQETMVIRDKIDRELENQRIIQQGDGLGSMVAALAAASTDPLLLLTSRVPVSATAGALRRILTPVASGLVSAGVQEAGLRATQYARSDADTFNNIVTNAAFGALFGFGGAAINSADHAVARAIFRNEQRSLAITEQASKIMAKNAGVELKDLAAYMADLPEAERVSQWLKAAAEVNPEMSKLAFKNKVVEWAAKPLLWASPRGRTAGSNAPTTRLVASLLSDTPLVTKGAEAGLASGPSVEAMADLWKIVNYHGAVIESRDAFAAYRKAGGVEIQDMDTWNIEVTKAMRRADRSAVRLEDGSFKEIADVNAAAKSYRDRLFNPMIDQALKLGRITPEELNLFGTASSYVPRIYDVDRISSYRNEFKKVIVEWLEEPGNLAKSENAADVADTFIDGLLSHERGKIAPGIVRKAGPLRQRTLLIPDERIENFLVNDIETVARRYTNHLAGELEIVRAFGEAPSPRIKTIGARLAEIEPLTSDPVELAKRIDQINDSIFAARFEVAANQSAIKDRLSPLIDERELVATRLNSAKGSLAAKEAVEESAKKIAVYEQQYADLTGHINRLKRESGLAETFIGAEVDSARELLDGLKTQKNVNNYFATLKEELGNLRKEQTQQALELREPVARIKREYEALRAKESDPKKVAKLNKLEKRDIQDLRIMRDRIVGTFGIPADPDHLGFRISNAIKRVSYLRFGGGFPISSINDVATPLFVHSLGTYGKTLHALAGNTQKLLKNASADELTRGIHLGEILALSRTSLKTGELLDETVGHSWAEKALKYGSDRLGGWSLFNHMQGYTRGAASLSANHELIEKSLALAEGRATATQIRELAIDGIDKKLAGRIAEQWKAGPKEAEGGLILPRTDLWEDFEVKRLYQAAAYQNTRRAVVTPGVGDLPGAFSNPYVSPFLQFKSFGFAATNRILLSGLQRFDATVATGLMASLMSGVIGYAMYQTLRGREISDEPGTIISEAIDRSGFLGVLADVDNFVTKATAGRFGIAPGLHKAFGDHSTDPSSRLANSGVLGALAGPIGGTVEDIGKISQSIFAERHDFSQGDLNRVRRMLPLQNLWYMNWVVTQAFNETGRELKIPDRTGLRRQ